MSRLVAAPALFALVYGTLAAFLYFALGIVADRALGLTPHVLIAGALFFALLVPTYVEGASLHAERGGATVFARYAFNELWSFVAGWALLLDYTILVAITAFASVNYAGAVWSAPVSGGVEVGLTLALIAFVAAINVRGLSVARVRRAVWVALADMAVLLVLIALGLLLLFDADPLVRPLAGTPPAWTDVLFAFTLASVAFVGLEVASGLSGESHIGRGGLRRLASTGMVGAIVICVGIGLVALMALPVVGGFTPLGGVHVEAPLAGVAAAHDAPLGDVLAVVVSLSGVVVLVLACSAAMLGLSRVGHSLATNRQVPSMVGRLHPTHGTPYVLIGAAALLAAALSIPRDLEFMLGLYAFGALLAFTLAHASVCALRFREPDRERPYRIPFSIRMGSGDLPLSAALGAGLAGAAWIAVIVLHEGAREAGTVWMLVGLTLYVTYRRTEGKPLLGRVTIPERALREEAARVGYASILVPVLGTDLDDDIIQTAARLAGDESLEEGEEGATIEALWVFEMPLTLPLDGRVSEADLERARAALRRAREVGDYHGVHVATATARARQAGQAIVEQARRRGVQAIVLAAEEPSRIRGGALLGGRGGPPDDHVGAATRYVVDKAPCRVILTAPPAAPDDAAAGGRGRGRRRSRPSPRPSPLGGRATGSSPAAGDPID